MACGRRNDDLVSSRYAVKIGDIDVEKGALFPLLADSVEEVPQSSEVDRADRRLSYAATVLA